MHLLVGICLLSALLCSCGFDTWSSASKKKGVKQKKNTETSKAVETSAAKSFEAMNTFVTLRSFGKDPGQANDSVEALVKRLEGLLSTTIDTSYIYRMNHAEGTPVRVPFPVYELVAFSLQMAESTDGALNPVLYPVVRAWGFTTGEYRVPPESEIAEHMLHTNYNEVRLDKTPEGVDISLAPRMMMDLGAVGKGYAGDKALALLKGLGMKSALMDLGGNVQVLGCKVDGKPWKVGITNPWGGPAIGGISVCDRAVVSSGGYERYFEHGGKRYIHIFDGKTGHPVDNGLSSVTIVASSGMYADALSTSLFVKGAVGAIGYWKSHRDFDMLLMTSEQELYYTEGIRDVLKISYPFKKTIVLE